MLVWAWPGSSRERDREGERSPEAALEEAWGGSEMCFYHPWVTVMQVDIDVKIRHDGPSEFVTLLCYKKNNNPKTPQKAHRSSLVTVYNSRAKRSGFVRAAKWLLPAHPPWHFLRIRDQLWGLFNCL